MQDAFGRTIEYLRLSVTGLCNLRCRYCMPAAGIEKKHHCEMLTEEEMLTAVRLAAGLGITKVRITGGEPLVKKNIISICEGIGKTEGIDKVCITTNGTLLEDKAKALYNAGVSGLNISLDTMDADVYQQITRGGKLSDVLKGIEASLDAGFDRIKINAVLLGGINDDEKSLNELAALTERYPADVRFIELMPMPGNVAENFNYVSAQRVIDVLGLSSETKYDGVCRYYERGGGGGRIGLITPMSHKFCSGCSRIRLTADGKVKPCLHSGLEYNIKGLDEKEMEKVLKEAIFNKPLQHNLDGSGISDAGRCMNTIGG